MVQITPSTSLPAASNAAPTDITPGTFERWPLANQIAYIKANGTGDPKSVTLGSPPGATGIAVLTAPYGQVQGVTVFTQTTNQSDPSADRNAVSDRDLFGDYEGVEPYRPALDVPSNFSKPRGSLTPQEFSGWPSVIQRAYLRKNGDQTPVFQSWLEIGPPGNICTAFLSRTKSPSQVYILETLDKTAIAKMSSEDISFLVGMGAFSRLHAMEKLGLRTDTAAIKSEIDEALNDVKPSELPDDIKKIFKDELDLIKNSIPEPGAFSDSDIRTKVSAIKDRYKRLNAFYFKRPEKWPDAKIPDHAQWVTSDKNAGIRKAIDIFVQQEKNILITAQQRADIANNTASLGRNLDAPTLIFLFQKLAMQASEATLYGQAEEMNQLNELIKFIGILQTAINNITKAANSKAPDEKYDRYHGSPKSFHEQVNVTVWLFAGSFKHPLEEIYNIQRPSGENFDEKTSSQWSIYGQQISDRVNTLSQQSQVLMNKYNSDSKAKDRFFDLANSALSKMNDAIQKIANAA